ncbi:hypothetical protein K1719_045784 [Acacia pycnantha]|nr:hypothetical protein K1719_045784 [Acacia pycnantha]
MGPRENPSPTGYHFKFLAPWLTHPGFHDIVHRIWSTGADLLSCIESFKKEIQVWNADTFGGIGHRKRKLFRKLHGIQRKIEIYPDGRHDFLKDLEISLREDLENVCFQEELLWLQKSSSDWVCLGDRNTSYYHLKALMRRKRNYLSQLKLSDGSWLSNEDQLSIYARQFFIDLYSLEEPNFTFMFPKLVNNQLLQLERSVTMDEIHRSLLEMSPLKSPGSSRRKYGLFYTQPISFRSKCQIDYRSILYTTHFICMYNGAEVTVLFSIANEFLESFVARTITSFLVLTLQLDIEKETGGRLGMGTNNMYPSSALLGQDKDESIFALPIDALIEKADGLAGVFPDNMIWNFVNEVVGKYAQEIRTARKNIGDAW